MKKLIILIILITLALACSSGGGAGGDNDKPDISGYVLNFKPSNMYNARVTDTIKITEVETGTVLWKDTLDREPIVNVILQTPRDLLLEVTREGGIKYVSSYTSKQQIREATRGVLIVGDMNALTTMHVEHKLKPTDLLEGVTYFSDLRFKSVNSDMVKKKDEFYISYANRINALALYHQLLRAETKLDPTLYNALYDAIIGSNDIEGWMNKAQAIDLPDSEQEGINLIANLLSENKVFRSKTYDLLKPEDLRSLFWKTTSQANILEYIGKDITLESGKFAIVDGVTIHDLNVSGNLWLGGNIFDPVNNYYTLDNTITNYYTLDNTITQYITHDNTITQYITLDNTITSISNTFITQLSNTFLLDDFDTITGNSLIVGNIILDGNLLAPIVSNYYTTLDNTVTNVSNTFITQLSNTFLLDDFDTVTGNSLVVGNIILDGNLLVPTVNNYYTTLDNTVTSVSNTFITQLSNTFLLTDFDEISGNTLTLADNLTSGNLFLSGNIYVNGNALDYSITNVTYLSNTIVLSDFDAVSGNSVTVTGDMTSANIIANSGNIVENLYVSGNLFAGNIIPLRHLEFYLGEEGRAWRNIYVEDLIMVSDRRLKANIKPIEYGLETIKKLNPVEYNMIYGTEKKLGLIAQEVEKVVPEAVQKGESYGVKYIEIIPILIKAIQEQQIEIDNLKRNLK